MKLIRFGNLIVIAVLGTICIHAQTGKPAQKHKVKEESTAHMEARIEAEMGKNIWPRDIFHCIKQHNCGVLIRGWKLRDVGPGYDFDGSVDMTEGVFEATKGTEKRWFWYLIEQGVEGKTGQSVDEVRVKQLESRYENPNENRLQRTALWSDDHSLAWEPDATRPGRGVCIEHPLSGLPMASMWITKEDCLEEHNAAKVCDGGEKTCRPIEPATLGPWKEKP